MFSRNFDLVLAIIFGVLAVVFFMGKGEGIMDLFNGRNAQKKKRSPEEERAYQRACGFFMLPLMITEILSVLFPSQIMGFVLAGVAVIDLVVFSKLTKNM